MAEQNNSPIDPFEDFHVYTKGTDASQDLLPPEIMTKVLKEALLRGCQRCIFTRFMPGKRACSEDTVSTIADMPNSASGEYAHNVWTYDTYIKAGEDCGSGVFYQNHEHQCIKANIIDDLYLGYTGGDPDAPVHRMDAATWVAEAQGRTDRMAVRTALAGYQRDAMPRVIRRVAMIYGQEYEGVYRQHLLAGYDGEDIREAIETGQPIAMDLAGLRQLPFTPDNVPLGCQPSADPRNTRNVYENIAILVINVPRSDAESDTTLMGDEVPLDPQLFLQDPRRLNPGSLSTGVGNGQDVAAELDWAKFDPKRLCAVFIEVMKDRFDRMEDTERYLRAMAAGMGRAGLSLDLLCLGGARPYGEGVRTDTELWVRQRNHQFERDLKLAEDTRQVRLNPIPFLKDLIKPDGRIVFVDDSYRTAHSRAPFSPTQCEFDETSLVL